MQRIRVSNHSLGYTICDTAATLYLLGYRGITSKEAPLQAGIAIHEAMADYFINGNRVSALHIFTKYYQKWSVANVPQIDRLSHDNILQILSWWFYKNPRESFPFEVIPEFVECSFEIPLTSDGTLIFSGRPDAIVRSKNTGKIYIVDHKTTSHISDEFSKSFALDTQMSGYWWVCEQYGLDVDGIYINAIELPKLSDSTRTCPTHKTPKSECAVQHVDYKFLTFYRDPAQVKAWYNTTVESAEKYRTLLDKCSDVCYIDRISMQGRYYKGVCQGCQFFEFCAHRRDPALADKILKRTEKPNA